MIRLEEATADVFRVSLESLEDCRAFSGHLAKILPAKLPCVVGLVGTLGAVRRSWSSFWPKPSVGIPKKSSVRRLC